MTSLEYIYILGVEERWIGEIVYGTCKSFNGGDGCYLAIA